jgi:diaminopimelate epimerase
MKVRFIKMSGAGNDFICLDNRSGKLRLSKRQREALCHRQMGIGADGLLILEKPRKSSSSDFRMRYYNADGGEAEMCGNGARCFARFIRTVAGWRRPSVRFDTPAGPIEARFIDSTGKKGEIVEVELTRPEWPPGEVAIRMPGLPNPLYTLNTGVPHAVLFVDDIEDIDIRESGAAIRYHARFAPAGTNVNFVQKQGNKLLVRTYERGVEDETLACGTGVTAVALIAHHVLEMKSPVQLVVRSGRQLKVSFEWSEGALSRVSLVGPATIIYQGEINV